MFENKTEAQARTEILQMVRAYCDRYHKPDPYKVGDRNSGSHQDVIRKNLKKSWEIIWV